jgi:hypothetical protein
MQPSYGRHDHRERHRYRSRLCVRQHGRDHRVPVGRVGDRMVYRLAAPAPPRTEPRRVTQRAAVPRWPAARITLRQLGGLVESARDICDDLASRHL